MAAYSSGVSVSWNGGAFQEVTSLSWTWGGGSPKGRSAVWTDEVGTVSIQCLAGANVATGQYGLRGDLVITGGGQALTCKAVYESVAVASEVNGVTRYTVSFRILDG